MGLIVIGLHISKAEAGRFLLYKHGLLGKKQFTGVKGLRDFVTQVGCVQYDPIDVCGKNAELVLQSRVAGFTKEMLNEELYKSRFLYDFWDKNMAIVPVTDWPYLERYRKDSAGATRSNAKTSEARATALKLIEERGALCSGDLGMNELVSWYWSDSSLARAVLETLYFEGLLIVHHKKNTKKYYDLASRHIPEEILNRADPHDERQYIKWHLLRRIRGVGMLWNKRSDAFLGIRGFDSEKRNSVFTELIEERSITELIVDCGDTKASMLIDAGDIKLLDDSAKLTDGSVRARTEFLAPLDNMLWDRRIIHMIFGFDYKWEIYTPVAQRKYGYYTLPVLNGDSFIGRIEVVRDKKSSLLQVKNLWLEDGCKMTKNRDLSLSRCLKKFAQFNNCTDYVRL